MRLHRELRRARRRLARALRPSRILASLVLVVAMGVAVWVLLLVVSQNAGHGPGSHTASPPSSTTTTPRSTTPRQTTPPTTPVSGQTIPLGVYAGPGDPVAATSFTADAGAPVPYAFDYLDGRTWGDIANPQWFAQQWNGSGFRMIWGVPMLPNSGASLAAGAAGDYNLYFSELGTSLVENGQANSIIMLGWDPQSTEVAWSVTNATQAAQYVAYWRDIVTLMRGVPGQQFEFVWDSAPEAGPVPPASLYPGNAFVDVVATDAFDDGPLSAFGWNAIAAAHDGPDYFATFAAQHNKPFMIAKWGVVPTDDSGGGDNSTFVSQFLQWADQKRVFAAVTWDYGPWAVTGGAFPRAAQRLRAVAAAGVVPPLSRGVDT
jgi:hypothetical protein